jgi:hypothetical protein
MAGGDHTALVMITHDGVDQREVEAVLRRRWPQVTVKSLEQEQPAVVMQSGDAADLGRHWRGVEPLRIVIIAAAGSANDHLAHHRADTCGHLIALDGEARRTTRLG